MKKKLTISNCLTLTFLLLIFSCSSDDDSSEGGNGINAQNLVVNFDENPSVGDLVGTIHAVSASTLSFSISSQTPAGALSIVPSTGELRVADASLFDFETNPVISATISILDPNNTASATATINLNDLDDIASFLSTSEAAYTAAADGEWVAITAAEYNALANNLNETAKVATTDSDYNNNNFPTFGNDQYFTVANNNGVTIPNSSYIIAFKYHSSHPGATMNKVKQSSTSISMGYMDLGGLLPETVVGDNYAVLKGSNSPTTATGYLAIYYSLPMGVKSIPGTAHNFDYANPDGTELPQVSSNTNLLFLYQGLSTTQKQW